MKQLSGGERSYTNVAFMLALGEYVESPFRWGRGRGTGWVLEG